MPKVVDFEHDGRRYHCTVEAMHGGPGKPRWWFSVTGDQQRYAPIETASSDTEANVKARIIAFYKQHLAARAEPTLGRSQFGQRGRPPAALRALRAEAAAEAANE